MHPSLGVNIWGKNLHIWEWRRCMALYGGPRLSCIQGTLENESFAGQLQKLLLLKPPVQKRWANLGINWDSNKSFVYIHKIVIFFGHRWDFKCIQSFGGSFSHCGFRGMWSCTCPASAAAQCSPSLWILGSTQSTTWACKALRDPWVRAVLQGPMEITNVQAGLQTLRWAGMSDINTN